MSSIANNSELIVGGKVIRLSPIEPIPLLAQVVHFQKTFLAQIGSIPGPSDANFECLGRMLDTVHTSLCEIVFLSAKKLNPEITFEEIAAVRSSETMGRAVGAIIGMSRNLPVSTRERVDA